MFHEFDLLSSSSAFVRPVRKLVRPGNPPSPWRWSSLNFAPEKERGSRFVVLLRRCKLGRVYLELSSGIRSLLSPIFSLRSWIKITLCLLLRWSCNWGTLRVSLGVCLYVVCSLVSIFRLKSHCFCASWSIQVFKISFSGYSFSVLSTRYSATEGPLSLHPVASFAALSVASFLGICVRRGPSYLYPLLPLHGELQIK